MTPTPERVLVVARAILAEMLEHEPYVIGYEAASLRCALAAEKARPTSAIIAQVQGSDVAGEKATPGSSWSPIETAPHDRVIMAWPCELEGGEMVAVKASWYVHPSVQGWVTDAVDCVECEFEPTLWTEVPSPSSAPTHRDFRRVAEDEALLAEVETVFRLTGFPDVTPTLNDLSTWSAFDLIRRLASRLRSQSESEIK